MLDEIEAPIGDATRSFLAEPLGHFIDGLPCADAEGEALPAYDPARGKVIAQVRGGESGIVDRAVRSARASFESGVWRGMRASERARIMWRYAELMERDAQIIAELDTLNNGMPFKFSRMLVDLASYSLRYFAGLSEHIDGRNASSAISSAANRMHGYTSRQPIGVAGLIVPWNGPAASYTMKVAAAIAAGCSAVVKPAESTPLSALYLAQLATEAGIPDGVVNVVNGTGPTAGAALVNHPLIDKISFTGSTETGKSILRASADRMKRVTLELGGKSPSIIFPDADLDTAVPAAAMAIFINSGQICIAGSRLFVHKDIEAEVIDRLKAFTEQLVLGDGFEESTDLGPLINPSQTAKVSSYIAAGVDDGADLVQGGKQLDRPGFFVQPTIFRNVSKSARIMREEIFGPVLSVTTFDDEDALVREANDTRYGLAAGVFTSDLSRAHRMVDRLEAGTIWVNCYGIADCPMPFGGFKESGLGREFGPEGLDAFLETKTAYMNI